MTSWLWAGDWRLDLAALGVAVALDLLFGEPSAGAHPVVWMGKVITALERRAPVEGRWRPFIAGVAMAAAVPALFGAAAGFLAFGLRELGAAAYIAGGAALLKSTFSVRGLARAAVAVGRPLAEGDLEGARAALPSLVSRDPAALDAPLVAAAAVESVAENSSDSFIGPWLAFAALGIPGAFLYRAVNTLDSMIGYRGRYEYLGKASARLDDLANLAPSRATALAEVAVGGLLGLSWREGWRTMLADHARTESPNAGWPMSAMAGLLERALEKRGHYLLGGRFRAPEPGDIYRAVSVGYATAALGLVVAGALVAARDAIVG